MSPLHNSDAYRRSLSDAEIRAFWLGCDQIGYPFGPMWQLVLLTAGRRREVAYMQRSELDYSKGAWSLGAGRHMHPRTHVIPLTDLMMQIINGLPTDSALLFAGSHGRVPTDSGIIRTKRKLDALMLADLKRDGHIASDSHLERWTTHDLRRTAHTNFHRLRVRSDVIHLLLNHAIGFVDPWAYFDEMREALEKWCALIEMIISRNATR